MFMSKFITYLIIILIAITVIILSNKYITVYKIYDITEKSNEINKNLPYYKYSSYNLLKILIFNY